MIDFKAKTEKKEGDTKSTTTVMRISHGKLFYLVIAVTVVTNATTTVTVSIIVTITVVATVLCVILSAPIAEPKHWKTMEPGVTCECVSVPPGSKEFDEVEKNAKKTDNGNIKEIIKVEK